MYDFFVEEQLKWDRLLASSVEKKSFDFWHDILQALGPAKEFHARLTSALSREPKACIAVLNERWETVSQYINAAQLNWISYAKELREWSGNIDSKMGIRRVLQLYALPILQHPLGATKSDRSLLNILTKAPLLPVDLSRKILLLVREIPEELVNTLNTSYDTEDDLQQVFVKWAQSVDLDKKIRGWVWWRDTSDYAAEWVLDWITDVAATIEQLPKAQEDGYYVNEFSIGHAKVVLAGSEKRSREFIKIVHTCYELLKQKKLDIVWYGTIMVLSRKDPDFLDHLRRLGYDVTPYTMGSYNEHTDSLALYPDSNLAELDVTLVHELGHRYWFKFAQRSQRLRFADTVQTAETDRKIKPTVRPVSAYGNKNIEEAFAEVFMFYVFNRELDRKQIESFKAVLKESANSRAARFRRLCEHVAGLENLRVEVQGKDFTLTSTEKTFSAYVSSGVRIRNWDAPVYSQVCSVSAEDARKLFDILSEDPGALARVDWVSLQDWFELYEITAEFTDENGDVVQTGTE